MTANPKPSQWHRDLDAAIQSETGTRWRVEALARLFPERCESAPAAAPFEVGETVECVDAAVSPLTEGQEYKILAVELNEPPPTWRVLVKDANGIDCKIVASRFRKLPPQQADK